ncbi:MAG: hypothetical protein M0Q90_12165 [Bacteroidales bacterium]|nr:hypothetical protein [Bacteroidales bacterium]
MKKDRSFKLFPALFLLFFCPVLLFAQAENEALNKTNANGQKQGEWKVNYPNGSLRYQGFFEDGKPVGTFQYYDSTGLLKAVNEFKSNGLIAYHQAYAESGFVIAKGKFVEQQKDSTWLYYSADDSTLISEENYQKGVLHGKSVTYYASEAPAEILHYDRGLLHGAWKKYFANGKLQIAAFYENGQLEGAFVSYHPNGQEYLSGNYHNGQKIGVWRTYDDEGYILNEDEHKIIE